MKDDFKDYICFTDMENIGGLNQQMQENFLFRENEIKDENIEKIQLENLKFGIYFSERKNDKDRILVVKNRKNIRCGSYFINGIKKEFYSDLFFLILYNDEKKRNVIFEQLIDSLLGIVKVKDVVL